MKNINIDTWKKRNENRCVPVDRQQKPLYAH